MDSSASQLNRAEKGNPVSRFVQHYPFLVFVILTLLLGWFPWYALNEPTAIVFMPFLTALIVAATADGRKGLIAVLRRAIRWRAPLRIWAFVLLIPALLGLIAIGMNLLLSGEVPQTPLIGSGGTWPQIGLLMVMFLLPLTGNIAEFGFRGYALPVLQEKWGPLWGTLMLGLFFGIWLLPEFFNPSSPQYAMGGLSFLPFFILTEVGWSFLMTWAFNNSHHSSLIAGYIFHSAFNFWTVALLTEASFVAGSLEMGALDATLFQINGIVVALAAVGFIIATRGKLGFKTED